MNDKIIMPIAHIKTEFIEKFGIPRQSKRAPSVKGEIVFEKEYKDGIALREIEGFSHLWLIFGFSENKESVSKLVRPPRLGGNKKVGVFASRSPFRPNGLGLSSVKLESVNKKENEYTLTVSGVDLLNNTPIYDIKPYLPTTDKIDNSFGGYADNFNDYKLQVDFPKDLQDKIEERHLTPIIECLSEDPRPSYQEDNKEYGMRYSNYNIKFKVNNGTLSVFDVEIL